MSDERDYTPEETTRALLYFAALLELEKNDRRFRKNLITYDAWDIGQQLWWIDIIEKQAKAGLDTIGVHVVTKAIEIRLTE